MNAPAAIPAHLDALLTEAEAAARLHICTKTLRGYRQRGEIEFVLLGGAIRYSIADLARFIDERRTRCDSTKGPAARSGGTTSRSAVVDIAALRAKREAARQK